MTDEELVKQLKEWDHCWPARWLEHAAVKAADRIEALITERDQMLQLVQRAITIFENCSVSTDACCCGDSMSSHGDAISCGHTPVDMGDYQSSLWLSEARGILKGETM